ncbi:hypothetical protein PHMEG_00039067 [Phytophthora megakarya]|uniref:Uncharacterized protein n=1 Tax=Phytophthora megakarya TaxID=4795 RepID=A0A225UFU1_9STRA|nr:hypothetical protein PHMEG_00039067 [Phytophthora megakarya]
MVPGSFNVDALFDLDLDVIQTTRRDLFQNTSQPQSPDPPPLTTTDAVDNLTVSSHYASAAGDGSHTSSEPPRRMSLGPSGASIPRPAALVQLETVAAILDPHQRTKPQPPRVQIDQSKFINAAMDRNLAEEREANKDPASTRPQHQGSQDIEMESIRSSDHGSRWEYDPDDVDFPTSAQATLLLNPQRVRISAILDLKEFTGKDQEILRATRMEYNPNFELDYSTDDGVVQDARHDIRQCRQRLSCTDVRLPENHTNGVIYYEASRSSTADVEYRSDELPLDYLYRLNVVRLRARLKIKAGSAKERREHVDHYIETLEDQDLAERLTLLRLTDADDPEEILRAWDRANNRQKKAAFGSSKNRLKPIT